MMTERPTDRLDMAADYAERERQEAIARHRRQASSTPSRPDCIECGNDIEEARQRALPGVTLCIECARYAER